MTIGEKLNLENIFQKGKEIISNFNKFRYQKPRIFIPHQSNSNISNRSSSSSLRCYGKREREREKKLKISRVKDTFL
jgi:hypothetical protein